MSDARFPSNTEHPCPKCGKVFEDMEDHFYAHISKEKEPVLAWVEAERMYEEWDRGR